MSSDQTDIRARLGLRPVINVSGTMTALGGSIVVAPAIEAAAAIMPEFVEMTDLHRKASAVIARLTGAEAGTVTASASAGLTMSVAAAMTGADLARIERLPDPTGLKNEVLIQQGHMVSYGAPVEQAIRLAGARVVPVGQVTEARAYQLEGQITANTAAGFYVISHHTVQYGLISLDSFIAVCRAHDVPVIVDAASEYDLTGLIRRGADLVVYSAHKFLGGPTAGLIAGRKDLVRAAFLQNYGIGRGMKVGKESIAGAIAALEAWEVRDHAAARTREEAHINLWLDSFAGRPGVRAARIADPTGNPLSRLRFHVDPATARTTAWELAAALASGEPPVIVRDHQVEHNFFDMDPCNLHDGEAQTVSHRVVAELDRALAGRGTMMSLDEFKTRRHRRLIEWPD